MDFPKIIDEAIKYLYNREIDPVLVSSLGGSTFVKEFATLHLACGRRVGKTTWINSNSRVGDLIICAERYHKSYYNTSAKVITITEAARMDFDFREYDWIFIDEPSLCSVVYGIKDWFKKYAKFTSDSIVIMLGE